MSFFLVSFGNVGTRQTQSPVDSPLHSPARLLRADLALPQQHWNSAPARSPPSLPAQQLGWQAPLPPQLDLVSLISKHPQL